MLSTWRTASSLAAFLFLGVSFAADPEWNCQDVRVDDKPFNFGALAGPRDVHWVRRDGQGVKNTTFTIDLCQPLQKTDDIPCEDGTYVCGAERTYNNDIHGSISNVITIAAESGDDSSRKLKPTVVAIKDGSSESKGKSKGLTLDLHGGKHVKDGVEKSQKATIDLICDPDSTGTEGFSKTKREEGSLPDLDKDKKIQFLSYKEDEAGVLKVEWRTKYACEGQADSMPSTKSGSWGFFTWFIIIIFLFAAAYIIFGSWLNYQRYGSKGFDLIPHSDTLRDLPYIIKEWLERLRSSGGSRGGYSAV